MKKRKADTDAEATPGMLKSGRNWSGSIRIRSGRDFGGLGLLCCIVWSKSFFQHQNERHLADFVRDGESAM